MKLDQERMINFREDGFLCHDVLLLVLFDDVLFLKHLEGIKFVVGLVADEDDFGVGAFANLRQHDQVVN